MNTILAAAMLGLLSGLHCAAMCGPLAIAGCTRGDHLSRADVCGYFGGRLIAYAFAGAVFGHLGGRAQGLGLDAFQGVMLWVVSAMAIGRGIRIMRRGRRQGELVRIGIGTRPRTGTGTGIGFVARVFPQRGLGLGLATGVLPCGVLVAGWALASAAADPLLGAVSMVALAIASSPGLIGSLFLSRFASRLHFPPLAHGILWCALGGWIAARPLLDVVQHCGGHA
jgi:sulfite exporter TauE/SafE